MSNKLKFALVGLLVVVVIAVVVWTMYPGPSKPNMPGRKPVAPDYSSRSGSGTDSSRLAAPSSLPGTPDTRTPGMPAPAGSSTVLESKPAFKPPVTGPGATNPFPASQPNTGATGSTSSTATGTGLSASSPKPGPTTTPGFSTPGSAPFPTNLQQPPSGTPKTGGTAGGITPPPFPGQITPKGPGFAPAPFASEPSVKEYTVKKGDSLWLIAKKEYGEATEANMNKIVDANKDKLANKDALLSVNMKLKIPAKEEKTASSTGGLDVTTSGSSHYTIQEGDTLSGISMKHFKTEKYWQKIWEANKDKIPNADKLKTGTEITIPEVGMASASGMSGSSDTKEHLTAPAGGSVYTIQKGDSFALISQKLFKSEKHWKKIWEANKDKFPEPTKLKVGAEIVIPSIEGTTAPSPLTSPSPSPSPFAPPAPGMSPAPPPFAPGPATVPGKTVNVTPAPSKTSTGGN